MPGVMEIGVAFATIGLICGGLVGGPIGTWLVKKYDLTATSVVQKTESENCHDKNINSESVINSLLLLALCPGIGEFINIRLQTGGILLPGFLTAMGSGIVLSNLACWRQWRIDDHSISLLGDVALKLFLAMSLMNMDLIGLINFLGPIAALMVMQVVLVVIIARLVIFPVAGGDYNAAVMSAGFAGIALGATPVGVANMQAVTSRFGSSPSAYIVIPLLGAFFLDISNAIVIQTWVSLVVQ